jgi:hypothetical protein
MKTLLLFLLLLSTYPANAQSFVTIPTMNAQWNCTYFQGWFSGSDNGTDGREMSYVTSGDTTIGGITYCKLNRSSYYISSAYYSGVHYYSSIYEGTSYAGSFRNDSINRRVYFMPVDSSNEKLLYDFSLQVGDTVGDWWNSDYNPMMYTIIIEAEDSVLINGAYRRRLKLTETANDPGYLIEGIGSTYGLLNPLTYFENFGSLECFNVNGQTLYPDAASACLLIDKITEQSPSSLFNIHPNPVKELLYISASEIALGYHYEITDYTGKITQTGNLNLTEGTEQTINITNLPAGFYFLSVTNDTRTQCSRFIKY